MALRVTGTACPICGSEVGTREKVLDHLRVKPECALRVLHEIEPMSEEQYEEVVRDCNKKDTRFDRKCIPRSGPIGEVDGRPKSQPVRASQIDFASMGME
eukprot:1995901-Amphidinium_carterae.3